MSSGNTGSLRPGWYNKGGAGGGGGRGFQPPPTVSDRGDKARSGSFGSASSGGGNNTDSENRRASNKFAALLDDDDMMGDDGVGTTTTSTKSSTLSSSPKSSSSSTKPTGNSRSEAFRSSFNRSSSTGDRPRPGRSLADLAASVPEGAPTGRRHSALYEGGSKGGGAGGGPGRFGGLRSSMDAGAPSGFIDSYKPDPKTIRYTREKLLSLRPPTRGDGSSRPDSVKALDGTGMVTTTAQDPVCWDTFDAESIWETVREKRASIAMQKNPGGGILSGDGRRPLNNNNAPPGRWQRGVALPQHRGPTAKEREADNPNELWDDPGGTMAAAADFSAFGALPDDDKAADTTFDFDKMAEASRKLEEELRGTKSDALESSGPATKSVDISRPLASVGTIQVSGDDVNVFEDFDAPAPDQNPDVAETSGSSSEAPAAKTNDEDADPSASSRLMKMIGVSREPDAAQQTENSKQDGNGPNPWGTAGSTESSQPASSVDPIIGGIGGASIPLNPWGGPATASGGSGLDIGLNLGAFTNDQKRRDAQMAVEREKMAQQEAEMRRRRQEQEAQQRAMEQQKAQQAAAARQQQQQQQQQQQPTTQQTQIELVLMERICVILENSWGQSDLVSILSTLHSEDSRVIPLLGNVDALRALIARSPQRVALRREPGFGGEMAVLQMTNSQWQQAQEQQRSQARAQQEQMQRQKEEHAAVARAQAQNRLAASINFEAPWFYSDPQSNIQGPFRGEEMRQWLEAGYFKGDLPICQTSSGPFHALSAWFPDLNFAFRPNPADSNQNSQQRAEEQAAAEAARAAAEAAELERRRKAAEEEEAAQRQAAAEAEAKAQAERAAQQEAAEREAAARELQRQEQEKAAAAAAAAEKAKAEEKSSNGGNESSAQLKMMLGLSAASSSVDESQSKQAVETSSQNQASNKPKGKKKGQASNVQPLTKTATEQASQQQAVPAPAPAAPAWGGVKTQQPRKSMSEIQQEEARAAAMMAAQRGNAPKPSSGWANVASKGTSGWSGGTVRQAAAPSARPVQARAQPVTQNANSRKVAPVTQQQTRASTTATAAKTSNPAEEFGISMSPALEKWCKEKMVQINGSDDTTLVGFCMTLNDANEIRQYLTTYLGNTSAVNNFATEFINKRGLGSKQEEWETPGSAKKGRKKKGKA